MKIEERGRRLQAEVAAIKHRTRQPFPPSLKRRLAWYSRARHRAGATYAEIGAELGIAWSTIAQWTTQDGNSRTASRFRAVEVRPPEATPSNSAVAVSHVSGLRIDGLDVGTLAELLRRLASS